MNDWPTVEVAVKRLGWERWLWNGGQGRWKRESEWSKGEAWVAEMKEDNNDLFWCGPCPITGKGEPPRDGGRARPASHARNGVLLHCDPCQQEFGVGKLEDIPDTRRDYWAHHRKLMARGR